MKRLLAVLLILLATFPAAAKAPKKKAVAPPPAASPGALTVFAAASLTNAMQDIGVLWMAAGHGKITFSFASSSTLAQQIENGAPVGVFVSADEKWMDDLAAHQGVAAGTRRDLLGNSLVLVEPKATLKPIRLGPGVSLEPILGVSGRLAVGDPAHVPAGIYAQQALTNLGLWPVLQSRLAPADSVRSALRLVELGEAPAGIVYATDVKVTPTLGAAGTFPPDSHDPIRYPAAVTTAGDTPLAREFLDFLASTPAQDVFTHYGFLKP
jgi:molybdate transport system substrate-binding protein